MSDAVRARHLTVSEIDPNTQINEAGFRALVSGEEMHLKKMYKSETKCRPRCKVSMFVNSVPEWQNKGAHHTRRRNVYFPMERIWVDEGKAADRLQMESLIEQGKGCWIAQKDIFYFRDKVEPHSVSFLRFFVLGAMEFYRKGNIEVPPSLNEFQERELRDKADAVAEYVDNHLIYCLGAKLRLPDIVNDFRKITGIDDMSFSRAKFLEALDKAIVEKAKDEAYNQYRSIVKVNRRDGSGRPEQQSKGMLYTDLTFRDHSKATWNPQPQFDEDKFDEDKNK
jgi:hypothetical protein